MHDKHIQYGRELEIIDLFQIFGFANFFSSFVHDEWAWDRYEQVGYVNNYESFLLLKKLQLVYKYVECNLALASSNRLINNIILAKSSQRRRYYRY